MTVAIENITPEIAADWLKNNLENQRAVNPSRVALYRNTMQLGNWLITGESIIFDQDDKLLNGQHRLHGCVDSKQTLKKQVIVRGIDRMAFHAMDTGAPRIAADVLTIAGHGMPQMRFAKTLATVAQYGILYGRGNTPTSIGGKIGGDGEQRRSSVVTHMDILQFVEKNPTAKNSTKIVLESQGFKKSLLKSSMLAWAHYQGRKLDPALADALVNAIHTGESLKTGDPFLILRELLVEEQAARNKVHRADVLAGVIKCWNAKRNKERIGRIGQVFKHDWDKFPRFS